MSPQEPKAVDVGENVGSSNQQPRGGMSLGCRPIDELLGTCSSSSDQASQVS